MTNSKILKSLTLAFIGLTSIAQAEDAITIKGQVRERSTLTNKNKWQGDKLSDSHELRTRLGVTAKTSDASSVHVEFQDTRRMGSNDPINAAAHTAAISEQSTADAKGVDLHQAFFTMKMGDVTAKLGRQKVKLGSQRVISSLEWHPVARIFDGLRLDYKKDKSSLTALGLMTKDAGQEKYVTMSGLFYNYAMDKGSLIDAYAFYDKNTINNWDLVYLGGRVKKSFGDFFAEEEFIYQGGEVGEKTSAAFQNALRLGMKMGKTTITLGHDIMSGQDEDSEDMTLYRNNYAFAHAYFGWMDYFLVNAAHTGGQGVQDFRLDLSTKLGESTTLKVAAHHFMPATGDGEAFGQEIDAEIHGKWFAKSKIVLGAAIALPGEGWAKDADPEFTLYFMPIFNF